MASLIESLVDTPLVRQDNRRMSVTKRPTPLRLREVLEVFGALGNAASMQGLTRSVDIRGADPQTLANAVLGRWLTNAELAALPAEYAPGRHLKHMLMSQEFRGNFLRRMLETFSEKLRLLHVRIPSCAGQHVLALMHHACPIVPVNVGTDAFASPDALGQLLGALCDRINAVRGIAVSLPKLTPFVDPPSISSAANDVLGWHLVQAPYRAVDLLFAIVRPPEALALSQVNGTLTLLRDRPGALRPLAAKLGPLPPPDRKSEWKRLARLLLAEHLPVNPICSALADGTAEGVFAVCARVPIQLVSLDHYAEWARPSIDPQPLPPIAVSEPFLEPGELTAQDRGYIAGRMAQDIVFYERYAKSLVAGGLPFVRGPQL